MLTYIPSDFRILAAFGVTDLETVILVYIYIYIVCVSLRSISIQKYVWHSNGSLATATRQRNKEKLPIAATMSFQLTQNFA